MTLKNTLHQRQYKIVPSTETAALNLNHLQFMGIWLNPTKNNYLLTIKLTEEQLTDPTTFEHKFRDLTGLNEQQAKIQASYGPLNFQRAVDSSWF
ncbi:hypothetical protein G9406_10400 [Weissella paramesenteroides]|uniref:hypothetical protein n=1 Tax=Weissella paramesenteroides TaxID=1249 RepID=UPI0024029B36|nr:hypothetical protein [Weissella paramesenteroides]MDF8367972.1 hypothetical protein [Weissella paramesenteroides]